MTKKITLKIAMLVDQNEQIINYDRPASEVVQKVYGSKCSNALCVL